MNTLMTPACEQAFCLSREPSLSSCFFFFCLTESLFSGYYDFNSVTSEIQPLKCVFTSTELVIGIVTELQYLCSIAALHLEVPDSINLAIFVLQDLRRKSP